MGTPENLSFLCKGVVSCSLDRDHIMTKSTRAHFLCCLDTKVHSGYWPCPLESFRRPSSWKCLVEPSTYIHTRLVVACYVEKCDLPFNVWGQVNSNPLARCRYMISWMSAARPYTPHPDAGCYTLWNSSRNPKSSLPNLLCGILYVLRLHVNWEVARIMRRRRRLGMRL